MRKRRSNKSRSRRNRSRNGKGMSESSSDRTNRRRGVISAWHGRRPHDNNPAIDMRSRSRSSTGLASL